MSKQHIRTTTPAVLVAAALALAGCTASGGSADSDAGGQTEFNVGYIDTSINGVGVTAAANELGLWEEAGLDANLIPFTNGPTQIQAMAAGSLDVGYIGGGATWMPATGQAVIIAPSEATYGDFLIAHPDSGATNISDLEGLRVGVPEGGSGEMILGLALEEAGLSDEDITKVPLDPPAVVSSFVSGQIDVAAIFSPLSDQIMQEVPDATVLANNRDFPETVFLGAWVASNQAIAEKPGAVKQFLDVYYEVNDYRVENTEEVVGWAAAESGAPVEQLQGQADNLEWYPSEQLLADNEDGTTAERFATLQDLFVKLGRMESPTPTDEWVRTDMFTQTAQDES
jgi:NitT/TauT family transport system substrate-binding protein